MIQEIREKLNLSTRYSEIIVKIRRRISWKWLSKDYKFSTKAKSLQYIPDEVVHEICKMIKEHKSYNEIYSKFKKYFNKFKYPKDKYYDIKTKKCYARIANLYY